jgi:hypothetical protein
MSNPLLWGIQFLAARQVYQGPPLPQLPRPLKPPLPPEQSPTYQITQKLSSLDSNGLRRIQIWVETPATKAQYKYIYRDLVQQHHAAQDVLWMTLSRQGHPQSQAEWFAPQIAPHHQYHTLRQEELYAGVYIAY